MFCVNYLVSLSLLCTKSEVEYIIISVCCSRRHFLSCLLGSPWILPIPIIVKKTSNLEASSSSSLKPVRPWSGRRDFFLSRLSFVVFRSERLESVKN